MRARRTSFRYRCTLCDQDTWHTSGDDGWQVYVLDREHPHPGKDSSYLLAECVDCGWRVTAADRHTVVRCEQLGIKVITLTVGDLFCYAVMANATRYHGELTNAIGMLEREANRRRVNPPEVGE